jgi:hypothetical protein
MKRAHTLSTLLVLVLAVAPRAPYHAAAAAVEVAAARAARVVLVGAPGGFSELAGRIWDQVDVPGGVEIARAEGLSPAELFRSDGVGAGSATAWVFLEGNVVRVRAADARRERFVFRELAVSSPLTEIDRESLCQLLKSELVTVIEGGSGALDRNDAEQALGMPAVTPPPLAEPAPEPQRVVREPVREPPTAPTPAKPAAVLDWGWSAGARYGLTQTELGAAHGPGIVAAVWSNRWPRRPGAWAVVQYQIEREVDVVEGSYFWKRGISLSSGVSANAFGWMRLEVGGGIDIVHLTASTSPLAPPTSLTKVIPVARTAARFGAIDVFGLQVSATVLLDWATRSINYEAGTALMEISRTFYDVPYVLPSFDNAVALHPGLALDLWWR